MNEADGRIIEQAVAWHLASTRDDMDWDGFTRWLEGGPRYRAAYDEIAMADAALDEHREVLATLANPVEPERVRGPRLSSWPLWAGGVLAASVAALLVIPQAIAPGEQTYASGGASRTIALGDGSEVVLGPHSKLTIAGAHGGELALEGGAYFDIRHDPNRLLTIGAGGLEIADIGTRFDVQTDGQAVRVEVSEGQIELRGEALDKPVRLPAGRRILFDPADKVAIVAPVSARDVGEWREGRLTYDAAPLSLVAADLARYAGISVAVSPPLTARRFSGTLSIRDGDSAVRDLAQLMGLELSRSHGGYRLVERR